MSTDEVYGTLSPDDPPFSETTPYAPNSPYAASKASSDHLVRAYFETYGLPTVTTNCSNNYGPFQYPEKLIPLMILNALTRKIPAGLWRRSSDSRLALCRGSLPRYPDRTGTWPVRSDVQHRRTKRKMEYRDRAPDLRHPGRDPAEESAMAAIAIRSRMFPIARDTIGDTLSIHLRSDQNSAGHRASPLILEFGRTVEWYLANEVWVNDAMSENYEDWIRVNYSQR